MQFFYYAIESRKDKLLPRTWHPANLELESIALPTRNTKDVHCLQTKFPAQTPFLGVSKRMGDPDSSFCCCSSRRNRFLTHSGTVLQEANLHLIPVDWRLFTSRRDLFIAAVGPQHAIVLKDSGQYHNYLNETIHWAASAFPDFLKRLHSRCIMSDLRNGGGYGAGN